MSEDLNTEVAEEVDVLSLLGNQAEEEVNEEVEEEGETEDIAVLKDRLSARNKSLRKSKQAIHRMQDEQSATQERLEKLEALIQNPPSQDNSATNQEREKVLEQWRDSVGDDSSKSIDYTNMQMGELQTGMVNALTDMKKSFDAQFAELNGKTDPERIRLQAEINTLRKNPKLAGLDDDVLMKMADALKETKIPRGSIGGQRVTVQQTNEEALEAEKEKYRAYFENGK